MTMPSTSAKENGSTRSCSRVSACRYGSGKMSGRVDRSWPSLMNVGPMRSRSLGQLGRRRVRRRTRRALVVQRGIEAGGLDQSLRPYFISNTATSLYRLRCCRFSDGPCFSFTTAVAMPVHRQTLPALSSCQPQAGQSSSRVTPIEVSHGGSAAWHRPGPRRARGQLGSFSLETRRISQDAGVPGDVHRHVGLVTKTLVQEVGSSPMRPAPVWPPSPARIAHASLGEEAGHGPGASRPCRAGIDDQVRAQADAPQAPKVGSSSRW